LGTLPIDDAPADELLMIQRWRRPYPPGKFRLNTEAYPAFITGPLAIAWAHRDRIAQQLVYYSQDADSMGPEAGTTYRVCIYDENGDLQKTASGETGTSYSYSLADEITDSGMDRPNERLRVTITSVRDGLDSWQAQDFTIEECRGYGMFYGGHYGE